MNLQAVVNLTENYWQPGNKAKLGDFFQKTQTLPTRDAALRKAANAGREILVIPEIVKSCLFYSLGEFHRNEGDYISTTIHYFYSIFHSAVAIYKIHFDYIVVPEMELNPNVITVKRKEIGDFIIRLKKEGLISEDYKRTYFSLQKRRDHVNYQPRVILGGKHKNVITFFTCQYEGLVSYLEKIRTQLFNAILETAELVGHALCFYYHHLDDTHKELIATMMFKKWSNTCIKAYQYWGSTVEAILKGKKIHWEASFDYEIGDKTRKSMVPLEVIKTTEEEMKKVLELIRANFLSSRIQFPKKLSA